MNVDLRFRAVAKLQAAGDIFEADARFCASRGAKTRSCVADSDVKRIGFEARAKTDRSSFDLRRDGVLDGVFDQRLDRENWNRDVQRVGINIDFDTQFSPRRSFSTAR